MAKRRTRINCNRQLSRGLHRLEGKAERSVGFISSLPITLPSPKYFPHCLWRLGSDDSSVSGDPSMEVAERKSQSHTDNISPFPWCRTLISSHLVSVLLSSIKCAIDSPRWASTRSVGAANPRTMVAGLSSFNTIPAKTTSRLQASWFLVKQPWQRSHMNRDTVKE